MLIASSSQIPRGTARRNPSPARITPARMRRATLRLVSGSPRRGSLPRGPKSSASRAPRTRRKSVRHEFAFSDLSVCTGPGALDATDSAGDSTPRQAIVGVAVFLVFPRLALAHEYGPRRVPGGPGAAGAVRRSAGGRARSDRGELREGVLRRGRMDHPPGRRPFGSVHDPRGRGDHGDRRRGSPRPAEGKLLRGGFRAAGGADERLDRHEDPRQLPARPRPGGRSLPRLSPTGDVPDPEGRGPKAEDRVRVGHLMSVQQEPLARPSATLPGYLPIADHGIIGDLHTVALVGTDGTIDWYCCPHFDSPSVFGAILDRERGGYYRIAPASDGWTQKQLYFPDTNVLITRFLMTDGVGEVQDFMPIHEAPGSVFRHRLIRRVIGVRGELTFRIEVEPRFNYGRDPHSV